MPLDYDRVLASMVADFRSTPSAWSQRTFVVLYGAPCTGKTTLGKEVSRQLGALRISTDLLRAKLVPTHLPEEKRYAKHLNIQLFELLARCASSALTKEISVVCEALVIDPSRMERLLMVAAETLTTMHTFFLKAPLGELERRLALREELGVNSEGLPEARMGVSVLRRLNRLCRPHPGTFRTFDTHLALPSEISRDIIKIVTRPEITESG